MVNGMNILQEPAQLLMLRIFVTISHLIASYRVSQLTSHRPGYSVSQRPLNWPHLTRVKPQSFFRVHSPHWESKAVAAMMCPDSACAQLYPCAKNDISRCCGSRSGRGFVTTLMCPWDDLGQLLASQSPQILSSSEGFLCTKFNRPLTIGIICAPEVFFS